MSQLTLKVFLHQDGIAPQKGKEGDAGLDCFACFEPNRPSRQWHVQQFEVAKISLGFSYAFWVNGEVSHDYFLDIRNRSGVGTRSGFVTVAEIGDANYRGTIHYCVVKVSTGFYTVEHGDKIAQAIITPFVDPHKVNIKVVSSLEELGPSSRGSAGFGSSGI
jgi:dUTP pyrophosphatase